MSTATKKVVERNIVIVGGGAAGIATASSLLKRQPKLEITIVEPSHQHYYQPAWTLVGAGEYDSNKTVRPMADCMPKGVEWIQSKVVNFEADKSLVLLENGQTIHYQQLVVATGLKIDWDAISGLQETLGKNGVTSNYRYDLAPYTWELVKNLKAGNAIFTQPPMPIKCAGAPQKALYLSCSCWERAGVLSNINVDFSNAGGVLFGVAHYVPTLMQYVSRYKTTLNFNSNLVAVDGAKKIAHFQVKDTDGNVAHVEKSFDLLHVVPPQSPPDCVKNSTLADNAGWVEVNQNTLQHVRYSNIFSLGDVCSSPNAKTAAAARKQVVVVADNLIHYRNGEPLSTIYDGYGSCPLTVEVSKVVLAEFGFGGKLLPTFALDSTVPRKVNWWLKKHILPWLYWHAMLKGREWLAESSNPKQP